MIEAKIFQSGNSQALRLPKEFRLNSESVHINRIGNLLVIVPIDDPWKSFIEGINDAEQFPKINDRALKLSRVDIK